MSNHTPEPWRVGRAGSVVSDTPVPEMGGSDAVEYYGGHLIGESIIEANARRIVACVNACAGMRNDELEGGLLIGVMQVKIDLLESLRDELLEAAKAVVTRWDTPNWKDAEPTAAVIGRLRAILQKIEGCEE